MHSAQYRGLSARTVSWSDTVWRVIFMLWRWVLTKERANHSTVLTDATLWLAHEIIKWCRRLLYFSRKYNDHYSTDLPSNKTIQYKMSVMLWYNFYNMPLFYSFLKKSQFNLPYIIQMIHKNVVDTAIVFFGGNFKRGLKVLAAERLGRIIQEDGELLPLSDWWARIKGGSKCFTIKS